MTNLNKLKIYEARGFINPARVRIALAEKKALDQVEFVEVDVMKGEHRQPAFRVKNPSASVPVLELECGTTIAECSAITEYIDHSFPGVSLTGKTAKERAVIHMMQRRAEQNLLDAVGLYFHNATPGLGKDLETYQNKEWGEKQREKAIRLRLPFGSLECIILIRCWGNMNLLRGMTSLWQISPSLLDCPLQISPKSRFLGNVRT
jgi:glutathione S-transferase